MSIKVYHAYKYKGTMQELFDHCVSFKSKWADYKADQFTSLIKKKEESYPVSKIADMILKDSFGKDPYSFYRELNAKATIYIFMYKKKIFVICQFAAQDDEKYKEFITDKFEDFQYQDQVFYKSNLPKKEQAKLNRNQAYRKKVWSHLLDWTNKYCMTFEMLENERQCALNISLKIMDKLK